MAAMGEATQHFSHLWDAHMSFIFFYHFYISLHVFMLFGALMLNRERI
jgi:hypothetical protein